MSDKDTETLAVPLRRLGPGRMLALHMEWFSGEGEDGTRLTVGSSAGLGGSWFSLTLTLPDGRSVTEVAGLSDVAQEWAERIKAELLAEVQDG